MTFVSNNTVTLPSLASSAPVLPRLVSFTRSGGIANVSPFTVTATVSRQRVCSELPQIVS